MCKMSGYPTLPPVLNSRRAYNFYLRVKNGGNLGKGGNLHIKRKR